MGNRSTGIEVQLCKTKNGLEIGCTTMWMYVTLLNCTYFKMVQTGLTLAAHIRKLEQYRD